jgi:hypothetical protein
MRTTAVRSMGGGREIRTLGGLDARCRLSMYVALQITRGWRFRRDYNELNRLRSGVAIISKKCGATSH